MLPFQLLFNPKAVFREYPVREWRHATLWLKWGLVIPLVSILIRVLPQTRPSDQSLIFGLIKYLQTNTAAVTLAPPVELALFFIILTMTLLATWISKSGLIYLSYQIVDPHFNEWKIATSIGAASMVNGIWWIIPLSRIPLVPALGFSYLHGIILTAYLISNVNRISFPKSFLISFIPGVIPFIV